MTYKEICEEVCKREGGKKSLSIAQVREVVSIISDLMEEDYLGVSTVLKRNGRRRAKKRG